MAGVAICGGLFLCSVTGAAPPNHPTYLFNFSTDAASANVGYSQPGLLPSFSVPGGDIFGTWIGNGGLVLTDNPRLSCPRPAVICPAGPPGFGMGFSSPVECVEVDAYSTGNDWRGPAWPWVIVFSVDRSTVGFNLPRPPWPSQWSDVSMEAAAQDAAADVFISGVFIYATYLPNHTLSLWIGTVGWNFLAYDGDGIQAGPLPACTPPRASMGLVEPSPPNAPPGTGDDLDGMDMNLGWSFNFRKTGMMSPNYPRIPVLGQGSELDKGLMFSLSPSSAAAFGVSPADILCTNGGRRPWVWATAKQLGLNPQTDDIDALAILGGGGRDPDDPHSYYNPRAALVLFSVSRNSAIVGTVDCLWGIPIMPSDILMPGDLLGYPGRVAILIPSGNMGLYPFLQRPPGVATDNLNALSGYGVAHCNEEIYEWLTWDHFTLCDVPCSWLGQNDVEGWESFPIPGSSLIPEGQFNPQEFLRPQAEAQFMRGDANSDGRLDLGDVIYNLNYLFVEGPAPKCGKAGDANDDGVLDLGDAIKLLGHLFRHEGALPPPFGSCGSDPTEDSLTCESYSPCE